MNQRPLNHLNMFGAAGLNAWVHRRGRGWVVDMAGVTTPTVFRTKTEALRHAECRAYAMAGLTGYTPYLYRAAAALRPGARTRTGATGN